MSGKRVLAMKVVGMQGVNSVSECLVLLSTVCSSSPDSPASHRESRVQLSDLALLSVWQARECWLCKVKGGKGLTPLGLCSECRLLTGRSDSYHLRHGDSRGQLGDLLLLVSSDTSGFNSREISSLKRKTPAGVSRGSSGSLRSSY